jgi:hypothetical protein
MFLERPFAANTGNYRFKSIKSTPWGAPPYKIKLRSEPGSSAAPCQTGRSKAPKALKALAPRSLAGLRHLVRCPTAAPCPRPSTASPVSIAPRRPALSRQCRHALTWPSSPHHLDPCWGCSSPIEGLGLSCPHASAGLCLCRAPVRRAYGHPWAAPERRGISEREKRKVKHAAFTSGCGYYPGTETSWAA